MNNCFTRVMRTDASLVLLVLRFAGGKIFSAAVSLATSGARRRTSDGLISQK